MKVYAEHGALRHELEGFQQRGIIELVTFPYENKNRNIPGLATPSAAQFRDLGNITIGQMNFRIGDMSASERYEEILSIVGPLNRRDALHVDSAYKSGCAAMLSRDRHIVGKAARLHALLGLRVFHPDVDWEGFVQFVVDSPEAARVPSTV